MLVKSTPKAHAGANSAKIFLVTFVAVYCVVLGFGWLSQTPSQEELYGGGGRFLNEVVHNFRTTDGIPWWSANFMQGHSMANFALCAVPLICGILSSAVFGDPAGIKIAALLIIPLAALTMFLFARRLTSNEWTGAIAAVFYVLSGQMLVRIGNFEHWMGSYSYIFPPLILWAFLKVTGEGSWRASAWLAFGWSAMMLSYAKLTFMFAPMAAVFFVWLLLDQPERRVALVRGTLVSLVLVCLMAVILLLPPDARVPVGLGVFVRQLRGLAAGIFFEELYLRAGSGQWLVRQYAAGFCGGSRTVLSRIGDVVRGRGRVLVVA